MEKDIAKYIIDELNSSLGCMDALLFNVKGKLCEDDFNKLKRTVARVMNTLDREVINKIIMKYPDLCHWRDK